MSREWTRDALCAEVGGDMWYPESHGKRANEARKLCRKQCPVLEECINDVMNNENPDQRFGVWGGMTPNERDQKFKRWAA